MTLDWIKNKQYDRSNVQIDYQREHAFTQGRSIGFARGLKYGFIGGVIITGVGGMVISLGLTLQKSTDFSKGLENQVQTPVVQVEKSR